MIRYYTLDRSEDPPVARQLTGDDAFMQWAEEFGEHERRVVARDQITPEVRVSTVFLGLDHRHTGVGEPLLFETMIFGGPHDEQQWRYSTWEQAVRGHEAAVELAALDSAGATP